MKQRIGALLLALFFVLSCVNMFAHSGRTDSSGGHNSPTGYHYHHGYPPHQHDGGVCPYDYDDRTGWNSGSSSGGSKNSSSSSTSTITPNYVSMSLSSVDDYLLRQMGEAPFISLRNGLFIRHNSVQLAVIISGCLFLFLIISLIRRGQKTYEAENKLQKIRRQLEEKEFFLAQKTKYNETLFRNNQELNQKLKDFTDRATRKVNALQQERDDLHQVLLLGAPQGEDATRDLVVRTFSGKPAEEFANIPSDTCIGVDGLPREHGAPKGSWGKKYTVYRSASGHTYHKTSGCAGADTPLHVLHVGSLIPCKRCKPSLPDMQWFEDYKRIKTLKDKYDIP